jgi:hypothetical protein
VKSKAFTEISGGYVELRKWFGPGETKNAYRILARKPLGKHPPEKSIEGDWKMALRYMFCR